MQRVQNAENDAGEAQLSRAEKLEIYKLNKAAAKKTSRSLPLSAATSTKTSTATKNTKAVLHQTTLTALTVRDVNVPQGAPTATVTTDGKQSPSLRQLTDANRDLQRQLAAAHELNRHLREHNADISQERDRLFCELKSGQELIDDCKAALLEMADVEAERDQLRNQLQGTKRALEDAEATIVGLGAKVLKLGDEKAALMATMSPAPMRDASTLTEGDMDEMFRASEQAARDAQLAIRDFKMMQCANEVMRQKVRASCTFPFCMRGLIGVGGVAQMEQERTSYRTELRKLEQGQAQLRRTLDAVVSTSSISDRHHL
ncbi:hypothetical protein RI367_008389 [Sorochytrium milnesiophthora]